LPIRDWRPVEVRARALHALVRKFAGSKREALSSALRASLQEAKRIGDVEERAAALAALVPFLPPAVPDDRVKEILAAGEAPHSAIRFKLIAALARHLPEEQRDRLLDLQRMLTEAAKLSLEITRNEAVAALIPELPGDLIEQAHTVATEIAVDVDARALAAIVPYLEGSDRQTAIDTALSAAVAAGIELHDICEQTLRAIARYLHPDQIIFAAEALQSGAQHNQDTVARLLAALRSDDSREEGGEASDQHAGSEPIDETGKPAPALLADIEHWPHQKRPQVLRGLTASVPAAARATDEYVIAEAVRAICDVASWWP
jgi:hypothetical protein